MLYVSAESWLSFLDDLPEGDDIGKGVDEAIKAIESANPELKDIPSARLPEAGALVPHRAAATLRADTDTARG